MALFEPDVFAPFAGDLQHPEGVCWDPVRSRIYAGGEGGQIYSIGLDGDVREVANTGGVVLGVAVDGAGSVYACDYVRQDVSKIDPQTGAVETYTKGAPDAAIDEPNWPVFDAHGAMYVTSSLNGIVFRVEPGGGETTVWSRAVGGYPNGCALAPDGSALWVAQSHPEEPHAGGRVWRIPIRDDGSAGPGEVVVEMPRTVPDGLVFDAEGNLFVAYYRPDRIDVLRPDGAVVVIVDDWEARRLNSPTNMCFAGEGLDKAVTANVGEDYLAIADLGVAGAPLHRP
jgi:sugar lactone lactonase YvrE